MNRNTSCICKRAPLSNRKAKFCCKNTLLSHYKTLKDCIRNISWRMCHYIRKVIQSLLVLKPIEYTMEGILHITVYWYMAISGLKSVIDTIDVLSVRLSNSSWYLGGPIQLNLYRWVTCVKYRQCSAERTKAPLKKTGEYVLHLNDCF